MDTRAELRQILDLSLVCRQSPTETRTEINDNDLENLSRFLLPLNETSSLRAGVQELAHLIIGSPARVIENTGGLSGMPVFHIKQNGAEFVVKAFSNKTEFLREVFGIRLLKEIQIPGIGGVDLLEAAECRIGSTSLTLLAMSSAKGTLLEDGLISISAPSIELKLKEDKIGFSLRMVSLFGDSLAKLHTKNITSGRMPSVFSAWIFRDLKAGFQKLKEKPVDTINLTVLEKNINRAYFRLASSEIKLGITHFDANPNNVFVDVENSQVTFIDVSTICLSQDPENNSSGLTAYDFVHAKLQLAFRVNKYALEPDVRKQIFRALKEGYQSGGGIPPTKTEKVLYQGWEALRVIGKFWADSIIDPDRLDRITILIQKLQKMAV